MVRIQIQFDEEEFQQIEALAHRNKISTSEAVRRLVLGACAAEIDLLRKRRIGPYFPDFSANRTTMHLKIVKIWPRFSTFSLRSFLRRRLLDGLREKQTGVERLLSIAGIAASGRNDLGRRHDDYLAEVFEE